MMAMAEKKVYGLIIPGKKEQPKKTNTLSALNIFGDDGSEDEEGTNKPVGPFGQTSSKTKFKKQNQIDIEKAMTEDPTVYEYDAIYDEMQASKPKVGRDRSEKEKKDKKPRYIAGLLKASEARKKEEERRTERKVQREREAEGQKFADKESFVTSAYKKKMMEMQEEEEKERREAEFEAMTDVRKQKDMSGFYRYLYRQAGENGDNPVDSKGDIQSVDVKEQKSTGPESGRVDIKEEPRSPKELHRSKPSLPSSEPSESSRESMDEEPTTSKSHFAVKKKPLTRNVRQRRVDSSSSDDGDHEDVVKTMKSKRGENREKIRQKGQRSDTNHESKSRSRSHSPIQKGHARERSGKNKSGQRYDSSPLPDKRSKNKLSAIRNRRSRSRSVSPSYHGRHGKRREMHRDRSSRRSRSNSPLARKEQWGRHSDKERRERLSKPPSPSGQGGSKGRQENKHRCRSSRSPATKKRKGWLERHDKEHNSRSASPVEEKRRIHNSKLSPNYSVTSPKADGLTGQGEISDRLPVQETIGPKKASLAKKVTDPAKKVYPHHNSPKDIEEAKKRYLLRKLERERAKNI